MTFCCLLHCRRQSIGGRSPVLTGGGRGGSNVINVKLAGLDNKKTDLIGKKESQRLHMHADIRPFSLLIQYRTTLI